MKKVFPNDMVAHVWAQQKQDEGRSGNGNLSFSGDTLYSYGTPIARIVTGKSKVRAMLLTSQKFSVTTEGKHKNAAWRAWHGNGTYFNVPFLGVTGGRAFRHPDTTDMKAVHASNRAALLKDYQEFVAREMRCMRLYPNDEVQYAASIKDRADRVRAYCTWAGINAPKIDNAGDASKAWERYTRLQARRADPKWQAQQERAKVRREERVQEEKDRKAREHYDRLQDQFVSYMMQEPAEDWHAYSGPPVWQLPSDSPEFHFLNNAQEERDAMAIRTWRALFNAWFQTGNNRPELPPDYRIANRLLAEMIEPERVAWDTAERDAQRAKHAAKIADWRKGENVSVYDCPVMMRHNAERGEIETSRGARFPVEHAKRAFPLIDRVRDAGQGWKANGHSIPLGHFHIDEITPSGDVKAGCHFVEWQEVERMARTLGLIERGEA